ncbi:hypothetical protein ACS0TY_034238 [Phlomoides rotata]
MRKRLLKKKGTPYRPKKIIRAYIFALFNENLKPGPTSERNFGLFKADGSIAYDIGLTGLVPSSVSLILGSIKASRINFDIRPTARGTVTFILVAIGEADHLIRGCMCYTPANVAYKSTRSGPPANTRRPRHHAEAMTRGEQVDAVSDHTSTKNSNHAGDRPISEHEEMTYEDNRTRSNYVA